MDAKFSDQRQRMCWFTVREEAARLGNQYLGLGTPSAGHSSGKVKGLRFNCLPTWE